MNIHDCFFFLIKFRTHDICVVKMMITHIIHKEGGESTIRVKDINIEKWEHEFDGKYEWYEKGII